MPLSRPNALGSGVYMSAMAGRLLAGLLALASLGAMVPVPALAKTYLLPAGPLSTRGNQIVDAKGDAVRILSVGVFTDVSDRVQAIVDAGFNTIRVEWGNRTLLTSLGHLDRIVAAAHRVGLKVILDDHFNEGLNGPCFAQQANGLWYDLGGGTDNTDGCHTKGTVTDQRFVEDWQRVARHFKGELAVIGYDLFNEPLSYNSGMSTWEPGGRNPEHNIRYMYECTGNAILAIDPTKLIICEGPQSINAFAYPDMRAPWGDLSVAGKYPVMLTVPDKVVYSVHDYPREIAGYSPDSGPLKVAQMNKIWGYLVSSGIAPVWIGEMGANMASHDDTAWARTLIGYTNGDSGSEGGPVFSSGQQGVGISWWWAGYDAHSGNQPSGIFNADGSVNLKQQMVYRQFSYRPD